MTKPFLIIQLRPEDATADNELAAIKRYGQLNDDEVQRLRAEQSGLQDIDLDLYSAIIVGGSPFDISTPADKKSPTQLEVESGFRKLFDDVVARDFPFLGCCSGNGLLGSYLGAPISAKYAEPVGGTTIQLSEEGRRDPLLEGFPETFRVLLGHKEACDSTPPGAVLLASNAACPVQMFRVKNNIYATQFHPEADAEGFTVRINIYKDYGYFPADSAEKLIAAIENEKAPEAQLLLKRFVDIYRF
ncbi:MAG: glutamine amidotransferase [SAR86 cluster bacterium]|uniref:Glutamine amidotransferase n=1 Tax=SAR86 cluster bacterium TaxID=2030880 RepID=A0A2A4XDL6_9GAMM|nr:MAG: glutamine amidotransferase [SAR86 cluster bacterium]